MHGHVVIGDRRIALADIVVGIGAIAIELRILAVERNGCGEVRNRAIVIVALVGGETAIVVSQRELRRQFYGAVEIGFGVGEIALAAPGVAAVVVGRGKIGIQTDRRSVVGDGAV